MTPDLAADLHAAQAHETIALDLLVAHGMPRDCYDVVAWVAAESTAAHVALDVAKGTRNADVARLMWASVEAVEAAFALWSRARRVIERCGRAEARRCNTDARRNVVANEGTNDGVRRLSAAQVAGE